MKQTKTKIIATIMLLTTALYANIPSLTQNIGTQELATQLYFNSSPKQDRDNSYDPNQLLGLGYGDVIVLPVGRVAQATSGIVRAVAPSVFNGGKRVVSYTDDVMLNTGIRADNYMVNTIAPRVKSGVSYMGSEIRSGVSYTGEQARSGYQTIRNNFLSNPTRYTRGGADAVESIPLGIPSPSQIGYGVGGYGLFDNYIQNELNKMDD